MTRSRFLFVAGLAIAALAAALATVATSASAQSYAVGSPRYEDPAPLRRYGAAVKVGDGRARSYVMLDRKSGAPLEIGVALDERALDNLPTTGSGHHGDHGMVTHEFLLQLPAAHGTPFNFVEMNWNPMGHEPDGVYQNVPHFDFHFYTISKEERDAIVPTDPRYAEKANNVPAKEFVPPFNAALAPPGAKPSDVAVPKMGLHWVDVRSAELQGLLGNPAGYKPFTATFIHGSWDGKFHFWEPMITRAHILEKKTTTDAAVRDQVIPISIPSKYQVPGYYPNAYRITWDASAKEYRIALTQLERRD